MNMSFSARGAGEEAGHDFASDPMYEFFDSIIKTSVLEILIKLIIFKDYAVEFLKNSRLGSFQTMLLKKTRREAR